MEKHVDLLKGPVLSSLTKLAIPIMATSLIQMAYNLTDMIWIGRIGSDAVAAVGAAGMYMWLSNGLAALPKMPVTRLAANERKRPPCMQPMLFSFLLF